MKTEHIRKITALIMMLALMFTSVFASPVYAVTDEEQEKIDEYKEQQAELEQKIKESEKLIAQLKKDKADKEKYAGQLAVQIDNYQKQIDVLNGKIDVLEKEKAGIQSVIDELNGEITGIEADIKTNEAEITRTEQEIGSIYDNLKGRLREVYVNGATSMLELLFDLDGSDDFTTYLILKQLSQQRAKNDEDMVNKLNDDVARIDVLIAEYNSMIAEIAVKRDEQQVKVDELNGKEEEIVKSRSVLEESQGSLVSLQDEAYAYMKELDDSCAAKQKLIDTYMAEIKSFEQKIDRIVNGASKGDGTIQSGSLIWPLQYSDTYISSGFGWRTLWGRRNWHGGVDTCRRSGTMGANVSAAADGTVIISTNNRYGYGEYIGIDHGNGVVTIYGHNSQRLVSVGEHVKQGQIIAYAGSTGNSTGAHVHFEVRVNGEKQNPLNYTSLP